MKYLTLSIAILFLSISASANTTDIATSPEDETDQFGKNDSLQPVNEKVFSFNVGMDKSIIKPVASTYGKVPEWGREHVDNFFTNLNEPKTFVNVLLQGKPDKALPSFWRFFFNSTAGLAGINDVSTELGLNSQDQNFSKTLESYGVKNGEYIVLPILGPSTERNTAGMVADLFLNPVGWVAPGVTMVQGPIEGISEREKNSELVDQFYYESFDPYSATRAAYLQNQEFKH